MELAKDHLPGEAMETCHHCGIAADMYVRYTNGQTIFVCPQHAKQYVPMVVRPNWYDTNAKMPKIDGIETVDFIPEDK